MRHQKFLLPTLLLLIALSGLACGFWFFTGRYYVGADVRHSAVTSRIFAMIMERSVRFHAKPAGAPVPDSLAKPGALQFQAMCVGCHGGPGIDRSAIGKGLNPPPSLLAQTLRRWNYAERYWIVEHGIKLTGMPSFGMTHSRQELAQIASFLQLLPDMTQTEYETLTRSASRQGLGEQPMAPRHEH